MRKTILLTGGAGYIGSHTYVALKAAGYDVVILDNFANAKADVPDRLELITGDPVTVVKGDVLDPDVLRALFSNHKIDGVVHFAALKAVGESTENPRQYLHTNIGGLLNLLSAMDAGGCRTLVFSSSATVYGDAKVMPIPEEAARQATNPYGYTKLASEQILEQIAAGEPGWAFGVLRYFNPVGAHRSMLIGEDPEGIPNNLMPYIAKVAMDELPQLSVFGDDYDTPDGTGVRDYIHVEDLARGHVLSLNRLFAQNEGHVVNLGTGQGYSVLEMLKAYSQACGRELPYQISPRRAGDVATLLAETGRAEALLDFKAELGLDEMCESSWAWVARQANKRV